MVLQTAKLGIAEGYFVSGRRGASIEVQALRDAESTYSERGSQNVRGCSKVLTRPICHHLGHTFGSHALLLLKLTKAA